MAKINLRGKGLILAHIYRSMAEGIHGKSVSRDVGWQGSECRNNKWSLEWKCVVYMGRSMPRINVSDPQDVGSAFLLGHAQV